MQKREPLKVDEAEILPAAQPDLETELENEKVPALPKTFQHTSDNAFWKEENTDVDLDNAMDINAEIQPIEETSLEEIKQGYYLKKVDENTSESSVAIKQNEKETLDPDAATLTTGDHNGEKLKPELKLDVPVLEEEVVEKTLAQTEENRTFASSDPNQPRLFVDQNFASALVIEELAHDLNEHHTNNEIQNGEQGESREFALQEEIFRKDFIEEKPYEATTSVPVGPAIEIFSVSPVPAEGQPFMAVVLVDNGNILLGPEVLGSLPFPVTIAVPGQTDVHRALMQHYRDAGFEVALLLDLADGSSGEKATEMLKGALTIVSEATGILELRSGVLQNDQEVSSAVVNQLAASGHGLLVYDSGMNPALKMAKSLGVPAKSIYRNLDQDKGNERAMRRFLDGAARRAQQEGSVIIVASPSPSVISALTFWNLQERSSSVIKVALSQALQAAVP